MLAAADDAERQRGHHDDQATDDNRRRLAYSTYTRVVLLTTKHDGQNLKKNE